MPAFEGLLPLPDDRTCADMLFELANWHALAKLRLHTEVTLEILRESTIHMYEGIRRFAATTCTRYNTRELPNEVGARLRRGTKSKNISGDAQAVHFNVMNTYKYHCLGDYAEYIERSGTSDNYSTQIVSPNVILLALRIPLTRGEHRANLNTAT